MPPLGAARFYVSHDRWQEKVADVARVSQLVVWVSGVTEGLRWEIPSARLAAADAARIVGASSLLNLNADRREAKWRLFVERLGSLFREGCPRTRRNPVYPFRTGLQPHAVRGNEYALLGSQGDAMKALLRAKGLVKAMQPGSWAWRSPSRTVQLLAGLVAGLLTAILLNAPFSYYSYRYDGRPFRLEPV